MIKQLWVKFDDLDIDCYCDINRKKCTKEQKPKCKEYVIKFMEVDRSSNGAEEFEKGIKNLVGICKKSTSELEKVLKKYKVR